MIIGRIWAPLVSALVLASVAHAAAVERQTPSGFPVPRYVSLKFDKVNARSGPGDDYQLKWVYRVKGLPVQVTAETAEWRRICDPDGQQVWVHRRTTDGRRSVMNLSRQPAPLLHKPKAGASPSAWLSGRSLASLDRCDKGWCKVKAPGGGGWVREGALWGTAAAPQCR